MSFLLNPSRIGKYALKKFKELGQDLKAEVDYYSALRMGGFIKLQHFILLLAVGFIMVFFYFLQDIAVNDLGMTNTTGITTAFTNIENTMNLLLGFIGLAVLIAIGVGAYSYAKRAGMGGGGL